MDTLIFTYLFFTSLIFLESFEVDRLQHSQVRCESRSFKNNSVVLPADALLSTVTFFWYAPGMPLIIVFQRTSFNVCSSPSSKAFQPLAPTLRARCVDAPLLPQFQHVFSRHVLPSCLHPSTRSSLLHDAHPCHPCRTDVPFALRFQVWPLANAPTSRLSPAPLHTAPTATRCASTSLISSSSTFAAVPMSSGLLVCILFLGVRPGPMCDKLARRTKLSRLTKCQRKNLPTSRQLLVVGPWVTWVTAHDADNVSVKGRRLSALEMPSSISLADVYCFAVSWTAENVSVRHTRV